MDYKIDFFKDKLKSILSSKRFIHSLGVADEAKKLALHYGEDENKAYFAGLVHDITKEMNLDEQIELLKKNNEKVFSSYKLFHSVTGAIVLQQDYGVKDKEILSAVRYHTTGKENMSKFEKIIYLADFIEVNRDFDGVEKLRQVSYENLDKGVLLGLKMSIGFILEDNKILEGETVTAYNYLIKEGVAL